MEWVDVAMALQTTQPRDVLDAPLVHNELAFCHGRNVASVPLYNKTALKKDLVYLCTPCPGGIFPTAWTRSGRRTSASCMWQP